MRRSTGTGGPREDDAGPAGAVAKTPAPLRIIGAMVLLVAVAASALLVAEHFGTNLPGCGPESDCAKIARSFWGAVPLIGLPTSILGLAYFLGLFVAWLMSARGAAPLLRGLVWLGVLASIGFVIIMLREGHVCQYCVVVHAANAVFLILLELTPKPAAPSTRPLGALAVVAILACAVLWPLDLRHRAAIAEQQEDAFRETVREMTADNGSGDETPADAEPFTGRYRLGPEKAAIRIVALTDFACPDCRKIEAQIQQIMAQRDDVSLSVKHFPMSNVCNPHVPNDMHPKACYAARVAEAAGMLRGDDGFFQMHDWLFENIKQFTYRNLPGMLSSMGYEPDEFMEVMNSEEVARRIAADVEEGRALGLHYTPMIFINGVELSVANGLFARDAVIRAVREVAATNPPPRTAAHDRPPMAFDKYIRDWRDQRRVVITADQHDWTIGSGDAAVRIVVWGDYQEEHTAECDRRIRALLERTPAASYSFRHYPFDEACNATVSTTLHPDACLAARAAEAAGRVGGLDAYWSMHAWLLNNQDELNEASISAAAAELELDPDALLAAMDDPAVDAAIREDAAAAKRLQPQRLPIPLIYVNGKYLPRWRLDGERVLERIVEEAAAGRD